jgi:hypothetical protein
MSMREPLRQSSSARSISLFIVASAPAIAPW